MQGKENQTYSIYDIFDYNINESISQQPDMPTVPVFKQLWYGFGRVESLYQITHIALAHSVPSAGYNTVVFAPKLKAEHKENKGARFIAREIVSRYLHRMGFQTTVNENLDKTTMPDMNVSVPLNASDNLRRMRVFGPYMMFDKNHMLTQNALSPRVVRTR